MKNVAIIMGSASDLSVVQKAIPVFDELGIGYAVHVYSAHRCIDQTMAFARGAAAAGFGVIIACAGMAAHLAGVIAANTVLPVIGVPVAASLGGIDALLSTVQMPTGYPVATVAVDGSRNAAYLAAEILAVDDQDLAGKLQMVRDEMTRSVVEKDKEMEQSFRG